MNFEELDIALEELELRLERLRALYEQYFLGFEKIEPQVPRKDVDRRIYVLRREKIRNTGKRFKLQTIIQRYNTYQQYWQRICREIENGTYKRHLARAERIMGADQLLTIAARRRFGRATVDKLAALAGEQAAVQSDESPLDEIGAEEGEGGFAFPAPPAFAPEPGTDRAPLPPIPRSSMPSRGPIPGTLPPNMPPRTARPSKYESLSLDMDFLDSWNPETSIRSRHRGSAPDEAVPPEPKTNVEARRPAPTPPERPMTPPPARPAPPQTPAPPPRPLSPLRAAPPPKPSAPRAEPLPKPQRPAVATAPKKADSLSDDRIKELHENLVRIKRENKEAGQVSIESLARTLRATEEKLRAEHKNRRIEFEVVLRDGKAVVKPKVR